MNNYICGLHSINSVVTHEPERIKTIFILKEKKDDKYEEISHKLKSYGISVQSVTQRFFDQKFSNVSHQGIAAEVKPKRELNEKDLDNIIANNPNRCTLLALDGVTDPHNLGACLRNADAARVSAIIIPKDRSVSLNYTVSKIASGAAEVIPVIKVVNLSRVLNQLKEKNFWISGFDGDGTKNLYEHKFDSLNVLVMGAEGSGLRNSTKKNCDFLLKIPMLGSVSSLNVSVATGIALYEVVRQNKT